MKNLKSREMAYLETYGGSELDQDTVQAIADKRILLDEEPLYIRAEISGGGEIELLTAGLDESEGVTNIDKRKLPKFVNFVLDTIQFGYATAATGDNKKAVEMEYASIISAIPEELQHARLIIKQNDTPIFSMPIKQLLQQEKVREFEGDAGYQLKFPRLIKQDVPFQISIKFPEGKPLPAGVDHFVEIFLKGARTRLRGAK